jgi:tetratricopeptide (TPR) repeat protein
MKNIISKIKSLFGSTPQSNIERGKSTQKEGHIANKEEKFPKPSAEELQAKNIEQLISSMEELEKTNWKEAYEVAIEIGKFENSAIPHLIKELNKNNQRIEFRKLIVATLGIIGDKSAAEHLSKFFCGGTEDYATKRRYMKMLNLSDEDELMGLGIEIMGAWKKMGSGINDVISLLQRYSTLGNECIESGKYKKAEEYFNKFIEMSPFHPAGYIGRGVSKHYSGDNKGACADWQYVRNELGSSEASDLIKRFCS